MKRKLLFVITLVVLVGLVTAVYTPVQAGKKDQWTRVPLATAPTNSGVHVLETFKESLYAGVEDYTLGLSIWRMQKKGDWEQVSDYGFGNPKLSDVMDMIPFQGKLYVAAGDYQMRTQGQLQRSADGKSWEAVTTDGFGQQGNYTVNKFAIFKDKLYVDISAGLGQVEIWRSASGAPGTWQQVVTAGNLGDDEASGITGFIEFKGALYAAIETPWWNRSRLWRTVDGKLWTVVSDPIFDDPLNVDPGGMAVFKDYLYMGMFHCDWTVPIGTGQIYRSKDGLNWEVVVSSFGDLHSIKVESLFQFEGKLYAGVWNNDFWNWTFPPGAGAQIWQTSDGLNWTQVNVNGFGDPYNWATHLSVDVAAYQGELYYGTLNDLGGQIWKLSK